LLPLHYRDAFSAIRERERKKPSRRKRDFPLAIWQYSAVRYFLPGDLAFYQGTLIAEIEAFSFQNLSA
jgi:hypothetical protein